MGLFTRARPLPEIPPAGLSWHPGDFDATTLGAEVVAVQRPGGPVELVPAHLFGFLQEFDGFETLESALARHAERHGWEAMQVAALREALPGLIASRLLLSTEHVRQACREHSPAPPGVGRIETLGLVTGGARLPLVERCVRSFGANLAASGRAAEFFLSDNSADPAQTDSLRQAAAAWGRELPHLRLAVLGAAEKRALARRLVARGACAPEVADFALFDPLGLGFSCGANRNALLLAAPGRLLATFDDDAGCALKGSPVSSYADLSFFSGTDPYQRWVFGSRAEALDFAPPVEADYLQAHEAMLGRGPGELLATARAPGFARLRHGLLRRLLRRPTRVRATFPGHAGDPGIPTTAYFLYYQGENRARLAHSLSHYQAAQRSRHVLSVAPEPALGDMSVCPGLAMGLDGRELLPPFFPVLHAEDFSFGAALWRCAPESVFGFLPVAITHEPPAGKGILSVADLQRGRPFVIFEFAHLLRQLILRTALPETGDAATTLTALGRVLTELGRLPPDDFQEYLRARAMEQASERVEYLEQQLLENPDLPEYWQHDVQRLVQMLQEAVTQPGFEIPLDLPGHALPPPRLLQTLLARYGALLEAWPGMIEAA